MIWATASSNLALVKYWGKSSNGSNQAASGSLSVALDGLETTVGIESISGARHVVEGLPDFAAVRVETFVIEAARLLGLEGSFRLRLKSNFPVAAGLASSASTFAAVTLAIAAAAGKASNPEDLAKIARRGSGSACRSLLGGFVEWRPDAEVEIRPVAPADHWALAVVVAIVREQPKSVGSREGMLRTARTSPYYEAWLESSTRDLDRVRQAVLERDLETLGPIIESNCIRMHASAMASDPPLLYWEPATVAAMHAVWELRNLDGVNAFFTIDAGPQVKVLCRAEDSDAVVTRLRDVEGVRRVVRSKPGKGPRVTEEPPAWMAMMDSSEGAA